MPQKRCMYTICVEISENSVGTVWNVCLNEIILFFFAGFSKGTLQNKAQEAVTGWTGLVSLL